MVSAPRNVADYPEKMIGDDLQIENDRLRRRLEETEETLRAIENGAVDALVLREASGHRVYTLEGADRPYRLMVERMQQGAATLYRDATIAYCNQRLANLLGIPHEKLVGMSLSQFINADDHHAYAALLRQGQESAAQGEARLRRGDGGDIPVHMTFNALPEDCGAAIGVLITDLTEQKHHEQLASTLDALRLSEERFRSLVTATTSIVWTTDDHGNFTTDQPSWSAYTGQSPGEYRGFGWVEAVHPEDRDAFQELWNAALNDSSLYNATCRFWHADSRGYRHMDVRGVPVYDSQGRVREWVGRCQDVENQVLTEMQMFRLMSDLKETDQRKNTFIAMLSHELRNPMGPILNALQVLDQPDIGAPASDEARKVISRQMRSLSRLVDDLLEVSRISTGRIRLLKKGSDLNEIVRKTVMDLAPLMADHQQSLQLSLPDHPVWIQADVLRLEQVLGNLLRNAAKYNKPGGRIWLSVECAGGNAVCRIKDNGIGIAADLAPRVFDFFTQADTSLDRSEGGLGVGLALVKHLVESHGGAVEVHSEGLGKGSEFTLRLPLSSGMPEALAASPQLPQVVESLRILVVDDLVDMAKMTAMLLESWGHHVRVANNGTEALRSFDEFQPQFVLLDIGMPGMDGYEVASRIRRKPALDAVQIVAISGYGQQADVERALQAGFDTHLTKPVEPDALKRILAAPATRELS